MRIDRTPDDDLVAISRNVSTTGLLMVTAVKLEVGGTVKIAFRLDGEAVERTLHTRILRVEPNVDDTSGVWRYRVGLQFDQSLAELEPLLREAAQKDISTAAVQLS